MFFCGIYFRLFPPVIEHLEQFGNRISVTKLIVVAVEPAPEVILTVTTT